MGTDIHGVVQVKKDDGTWQTVLGMYRGRNYDLFAILADVRNSYGFAGVSRGDRFEPIADSRGLPSDVNNDNFDFGDHSFSWVTLREILDVRWDTSIKRTGVISAKEFDEWDRTKPPQSYCGSVGGKDVHTHNENVYMMLKNTNKLPTGNNFVQVYWTETYRGAVGTNFFTWLKDEVYPAASFKEEDQDRVRKIRIEGATERSADDIRFVFGFDS